MPSPTPTPDSPPAPVPAPGSPGDTAYYHQVLHTLIAQGANLARMVHDDAEHQFAARKDARTREAQATRAHPEPPHPEAPPAIPDPTPAFERLARTVRRCIAQAQALTQAQARPTPSPAHARTRARTALIRGVEDAIHVSTRMNPGTDAPTLRAELAERLDDPDLDADLLTRPVADVIEGICRDLGIAMQGRSYVWQRRTPADIAHLRARAEARPGAQPPPPQPHQAQDNPPPSFDDLLALATHLARDG